MSSVLGLGLVLPRDPCEPQAAEVGEIFAEGEFAVEVHAGNGLDSVILVDHALGALA